MQLLKYMFFHIEGRVKCVIPLIVMLTVVSFSALAGFVENGVSIDFEIKPLDNIKRSVNSTSGNTAHTAGNDIHIGQEAVINFVVKNAFTGAPVKGLLPDSFLQHKPNATTDEEINTSIKNCRFRALKRGHMHGGHPSELENTYVMCLNSSDNTISVIDPLMKPGFIIKKIPLPEKCVDMEIGEYGSDLYVTSETGKVVIIDCNMLEVVKSIYVGATPHHVVFQPDGRFVWVGNDGDGTVAVIDSVKRSLIKNIPVGKGHHEIVFTEDSFYAFITNRDDDSVTVVDVNSFTSVKTLKTGKSPHGLAYSILSQYVYIANEGDGTISVLDTIKQEIVSTLQSGKGVRTIAFDDNGRFCFALNKKENSVSIFDVSRNRIVKTMDTGIRPESIVVSEKYLYIRNTGSPDVTVIKLKGLISEGEISIGSVPPNNTELKMGHVDMADSYMVIVPNPADGIVYTIIPGDDGTAFKYHTGTSGTTKVALFWTGLKETAPGVYSRVVKFDEPGRHEVGLYISSPELTACFEINVAASSAAGN